MSSLARGFQFACIIITLTSASAFCAEIAPEAALRKKIKEGGYEERKEVLDTHNAMGEVIVQALIEVAKDEKREPKERIEAIIRLNQIGRAHV